MPSIGSTKQEIARSKEAASRNLNGGRVLIDDGSGRLREQTPADTHSLDCACHFCRKVCCLACHQHSEPGGKIWVGLTGFGRHVQSRHPHLHIYDASVARQKRLIKQLKQVAAAKEIRRVQRSGIRRVNLKNITERDLQTLAKWVADARVTLREGGGNSSADPLLLGAIEKADEHNLSRRRFEVATRALASEIERGRRTGVLVTSQRTTHYDPRVAAELFKIAYALGKGWSFVNHIVLLYGLEALCKELATEGLSPPTTIPKIPKPEDILRSGLDVLKQGKSEDD